MNTKEREPAECIQMLESGYGLGVLVSVCDLGLKSIATVTRTRKQSELMPEPLKSEAESGIVD